MKLLSKLRAIVVGGGAGVGRSTALRFSEHGAKVAIVDIDPDAAAATGAMITAAGREAWWQQADATDPASMEIAVRGLLTLLGGVDTVVLSVYLERRAPLTELGDEDWRRVLDVGVTSGFVTARAALPALVDSRRNSSLTLISSVQAMIPSPGTAAYAAGKSALLGLTRQLAVEYGPLGVRVNALTPGLILNDRNRPRFDLDPERLRRIEACYPLRRAGRPDDVADVAVFLASDLARYVTGASIAVDGGLMAQSPTDAAEVVALMMSRSGS